jgi:hypothetical protein
MPSREDQPMAEIVNLNRFRKARDRADAEVRAAKNRRRFGRSKAERGKDRAEAEKAAKDLDGKRLD